MQSNRKLPVAFLQFAHVQQVLKDSSFVIDCRLTCKTEGRLYVTCTDCAIKVLKNDGDLIYLAVFTAMLLSITKTTLLGVDDVLMADLYHTRARWSNSLCFVRHVTLGKYRKYPSTDPKYCSLKIKQQDVNNRSSRLCVNSYTVFGTSSRLT